MIGQGRSDLVRAKQAREPKKRTQKKEQQELGCSDDSNDDAYLTDLTISNKDKLRAISKNESQSCTLDKPTVQTVTAEKEAVVEKIEAVTKVQSEERQSTSEITPVESTVKEPRQLAEEDTKNVNKSKNIMSSIKKFFKF